MSITLASELRNKYEIEVPDAYIALIEKEEIHGDNMKGVHESVDSAFSNFQTSEWPSSHMM